MGKKKGSNKKKEVQKVQENVPKTFVIKSGQVGKSVKELKQNLRQVFQPNTASKLKEKSNNVMKDFFAMAGPLGVSHFLIFSSTINGTYLRMAKFPRGPTLTFRVLQYSLMRDISNLLKNPTTMSTSDISNAPLLILGGFPKDESHYQLTSVMLQNMFPPLNVKLMKINQCRRVVIFAYNQEDETIEFRHYAIKVRTVGLTRGVKKVVRRDKNIPNLGKFSDISEYIMREADESDSEREDGPDNIITMKKELKKNFSTAAQTAVRLVEMGPRMKLQLVKITEGLLDGKVIYHRFIQKSPQEIAELDKKKEQERALKQQRRKEQQRNVDRKKKKPISEKAEDPDADYIYNGSDEESGAESGKDDDDLEWYRKEVGEEPDPDEFKKNNFETDKKRKFNQGNFKKFKKNRPNDE